MSWRCFCFYCIYLYGFLPLWQVVPYLWQGYKLGEQRKCIFVKKGEWIERKHSKFYVSYMYQSGFNQVNRGNFHLWMYVLRSLLAGTGSHGYMVWLGERNLQGRWTGCASWNSGARAKVAISSASGRLTSALEVFCLLASGPPRSSTF